MENQNQNINQTPPVSPVVQVPPVSSPINPPTGQKSKFPLGVIIGIALFLLVAGSAAGFYVFKQQSSKIAVKPTPAPSKAIKLSPTPNPTASWKTYTNTFGNISFKYPSVFIPDQEKIESRNIIAENITVSIHTVDFNTSARDNMRLTIEENGNFPDNSSYQNFVSQGYPNKTGLKEISFGSLSSFLTTDAINPGEPFYSSAAGIYKNGKIYSFVMDSPQSLENKELILRQILSTFKFTDQAITPLSVQDIAQIKQLLATLDNTTVDKIVFTQDQQKYSNFASGGFGQTGVAGGAKWFAAKINNQWKIIFTGNGAIPNCSDIAQYNPPKDFLPCN